MTALAIEVQVDPKAPDTMFDVWPESKIHWSGVSAWQI